MMPELGEGLDEVDHVDFENEESNLTTTRISTLHDLIDIIAWAILTR